MNRPPSSESYLYDTATGRKAGIDYSNGAKVRYAYDEAGNVEEILHEAADTDELLKLTYTRDDRGLITGLTEVREETDTVVWTYVYDGARRLTNAERIVNGGSPEDFAYAYDAAGNRLTKTERGTATITYSYNSLGQLYACSGGASRTYAYDVYGNQIEEKNGEDKVYEYAWDGSNRLIQAKVYDAGGSLLKTLAFGYDDRFGSVRLLTDVSGESPVSDSLHRRWARLIISASPLRIAASQ